MANLISLKLQ
ncbi:hypothetical protein F383_22781 [Gossypium arboreum]|uniref:Uncharacterized protein n=1 Tax=Gossypium arboreum TaxID=29729 RepID=A0A0B0NYE6_GOSAR|nr:hypothetical protein F383_22781 [Gossypium arboreum]